VLEAGEIGVAEVVPEGERGAVWFLTGEDKVDAVLGCESGLGGGGEGRRAEQEVAPVHVSLLLDQ
jgi:hypothetical protein